MKYCIMQDKKERMHVNWELNGVTANMISWFWCNLEKCNFPGNSKMKFDWMSGYGAKENGSPLDAVYTMTQHWYDGSEIQNYLRIEQLEHVPNILTELIQFDHVVALGGISIFGNDVCADDPAFAWRLHQWQKTDEGVRGITSAYTKPGVDIDSGQAWANRTVDKLGEWEKFLPDIYRMYQQGQALETNKFFSFKITEQLKYCS